MDTKERALKYQFGLQAPEGYWWYTLEANETICAEYIFLMHFMAAGKDGEPVDDKTVQGLAKRILSCQRIDGTWALYYNGPADLSTTIECYWALKLAGYDCGSPNMRRALDFILTNGGITRARVFTKIHLAQFGLVPWDACPAMPVELMLLPTWSPVNIYEFSSWARACIIPLLVVLQKRPVRPLFCHCESASGGRSNLPFNLDELFAEPPSQRKWHFKTDKSFLSWERFFIELNKVLKITTRLPFCPFDGPAIKRCEEWICEHIAKTEDIFPALAYGAVALSSIGYPSSHPIIKKALDALKSFQQTYDGELPSSVIAPARRPFGGSPPKAGEAISRDRHAPTGLAMTGSIHQQCCISPVWDTPWQITALLDAGVSPDNPDLIRSGRWLLSKEITGTRGDWSIKNSDTEPSGWSFEFENEYFPDTDDTIQVLHVLNRLNIPMDEKSPAIKRGFKWLLSMQGNDGGWAAFDINQDLKLVNRIPFSDHGACLDESCADITGRVLTLMTQFGNEGLQNLGVIASVSEAISIKKRALDFLKQTQENFGAWSGRWGTNYIYGTWCALTGLAAICHCEFASSERSNLLHHIEKGILWLKSIQHVDGGWSESPETYKTLEYLPYPNPTPKGVPSQTAWAVMGLIAAHNVTANAGEAISQRNVIASVSEAISRGVDFLTKNLREDGTWDEKEYTGTGFPNHFYIRYHGYRHFFPLMALSKSKLL